MIGKEVVFMSSGREFIGVIKDKVNTQLGKIKGEYYLILTNTNKFHLIHPAYLISEIK